IPITLELRSGKVRASEDQRMSRRFTFDMASRLLLSIAALAGLIAAGGCNQPSPFKLKEAKVRSDREAPYNPQENYPEWAYDKPSYVKPTSDLQPEVKAREEDPLNYFTNKKLFPVRQPTNYKPEEIPRVAVWYSDNNGFDWKRAGYIGRSETYYWFDASGDGD